MILYLSAASLDFSRLVVLFPEIDRDPSLKRGLPENAAKVQKTLNNTIYCILPEDRLRNFTSAFLIPYCFNLNEIYPFLCLIKSYD